MAETEEVSEAIRLLAPGIPVTLVHQETGATKDVILKYTALSIASLEEEYGSLFQVTHTLEALTAPKREPDLAELWRIVAENKTPEEFEARFESPAVAVEMLRSTITDSRSVRKTNELARLLAPGLVCYDAKLNRRPVNANDYMTGDPITAEEAVYWVSMRSYNDLLNLVVLAFYQGLTLADASVLEEDKKNDEGEPQGNETGPSTGASSSTSAPSDSDVQKVPSGV